MTTSNDSSFEMHDDSLSHEEVEHLVDGTSERPDLAELEALFAEVRALPKSVDTPPVSAALAEFIGVNLTPTAEPIVLPDTAEATASAIEGTREAEPVRRTSMIGSAAAFLGTMGGKVALCTTVAAASVGGAHATGAVDVPFLPDNDPAVIETVDLPDSPDPLAFFEDVQDIEEVDEKESADTVEDVDEREAEKVVDVDEKSVLEKIKEKDALDDEVAERQPKVIVDDEDEKDEGALEEEPKKEEPKEEPKKEEPKEEPKKEEPKKDDDKSEAEKAKQEQLEALEEALHIAKDKVRADATALIKPLEEERDGLLEDLEAAHRALAEEWEPIIDQLLADLEATDNEQERIEIEEDIDAAETAWSDARVAAELEVDPRLEEIDELFHQIETERDAEIDRLIAEFLLAVEEIENS